MKLGLAFAESTQRDDYRAPRLKWQVSRRNPIVAKRALQQSLAVFKRKHITATNLDCLPIQVSKAQSGCMKLINASAECTNVTVGFSPEDV